MFAVNVSTVSVHSESEGWRSGGILGPCPVLTSATSDLHAEVGAVQTSRPLVVWGDSPYGVLAQLSHDSCFVGLCSSSRVINVDSSRATVLYKEIYDPYCYLEDSVYYYGITDLCQDSDSSLKRI